MPSELVVGSTGPDRAYPVRAPDLGYSGQVNTPHTCLCTASSASRAGGGTGRAERLSQGGQVSGVPGPPGRVVQERAELVQGGEDLAADLLHRAHRVDRDQDLAVAVPAQDRRCHLMVEGKALGDDLRGV